MIAVLMLALAVACVSLAVAWYRADQEAEGHLAARLDAENRLRELTRPGVN